jgi:type II secretory ATPase GspE/PulE/Tfp pilus assembly ATPase PilB-like protein
VFPRLTDIGIQPGILSGNIIGVIAQRLVRKLCPHCKEAYTPDEHEARILGADPAAPPQIYRAAGCPACSQKGYRGRLALIELLRMDPTLDELVANHAPLHDIRRAAFEHGYHPLAEDGLQRVRDGITSLAEVARVVDLTGRV